MVRGSLAHIKQITILYHGKIISCNVYMVDDLIDNLNIIM